MSKTCWIKRVFRVKDRSDKDGKGIWQRRESRHTNGTHERSRLNTLTDLIEEVRPQALAAGIPADEFETMTFVEILDQMRANRKIRQDKVTMQAVMDHKQAELIAYAFNDPQHMPGLKKAYPFLDKLVDDEPHEEIPEWKLEQAEFLSQAMRVKAAVQRKKEAGDHV
ncbi:hypothetical protein [Lacticaseibacillus saniviri]|nr:hypothetical protein [Lacticaseibacillus saniviri]